MTYQNEASLSDIIQEDAASYVPRGNVQNSVSHASRNRNV